MSTLLGPLAAIAASARLWQSRSEGLGMTWAGLWLAEQRQTILDAVAAHTRPVDAAQKRRWKRQGALPGVRSYAALLAILPLAPDEGAGEAEPFPGIPVWDHGVFARATISEARHAVHLMRHLDDYHEPTLAALKRKQLRRLVEATDEDIDAAAQAEAGRQAAQEFLEAPVRWRDAVQVTIYRAAVRHLEAALGMGLRGPGRTLAQLEAKWEHGLALLESAPAAEEAARWLRDRLASLAQSRVCLQYEEHRYLQLTGVRAGRSTRHHLPRGLHLVFSDDSHRREDRIAHLWLDTASATQRAGAFAWAPVVPADYAARKRTAPLRLKSEADVHQYVEGEASATETEG